MKLITNWMHIKNYRQPTTECWTDQTYAAMKNVLQKTNRANRTRP